MNTATRQTASVDHLVGRAADKADAALESTKSMAHSALDQIQSSVDDLRRAAPNAFARAATQVEDIAKRGMERAKDAGGVVRERAARVGDRGVSFVRDEPVKAVLIAAITGAAVAALVTWLVSDHDTRGTYRY
jgi:ElaB/YqjD/DUF883 family membrane-anchored ribosome-binding protein